MGIRGVLWDMDGVLVDTGEFHYQAWADILASHDIPFSHELFLKTFGMNNWGVLSTVLGHMPDKELHDRLSNQKEAHFREIIKGKAQPLPGVVELLDLLKSKGLRQAVASSAPPENIDTLVDALNIRDRFDAILSGYMLNGKPAPDVFLAAAQAIQVPPNECLVIEDAVTGVEGARRAGMRCVAVTNTNPAEKLQQADYVLDSLLQITPDFLEKLLAL
jgi:beta-phosphoglucomutase family hydrolase